KISLHLSPWVRSNDIWRHDLNLRGVPRIDNLETDAAIGRNSFGSYICREMVVGSGLDCDVLKQILKINVLRSVELHLERAGTCVCYAVIKSKLSSRCRHFPPIETTVHDFMLKPAIENKRSSVARI